MSLGILVKCKEDMEVINTKAIFRLGILYILMQDDEGILWVISGEHIPANVTNREIFNRHFELTSNGS